MAESLRMSLREPLSPDTVDAIWHEIERRRHSRSWSLAVVPSLSLAGVIALTLVWWLGPGTRPAALPVALPSASLHWSGATLGAVEARPGEGARRVSLSDGTTIALDAGTRVVPRVSTAMRFEIAVERGRARFEVKPQGSRTFAVVAGPARVEVIGTVFAVGHGARGVSVSVEHGRVRVHAQDSPDEGIELGPGRVWSSSEARTSEASTTKEGVPDTTGPQEPAPAEAVPRAPEADRAREDGWRRAVRAGDFREAYRALGSNGFEQAVREATDAATLLDLSDVARAAGHPRRAASTLARLLDRHRRDERAPLAALTLGRLRLDALGEPATAANALDLALALGLPGTLREDALARLVEAHARAGDTEAAARRADEYRTAFPAGRWRASVDRWGARP